MSKVLHSIGQWWKCSTSVCSICKMPCFESVKKNFIRKFIEIHNLYRKRWLFGYNQNFVSDHGQSNHWSHKIHNICNILFGDSIPVTPWQSLCQYGNSKKNCIKLRQNAAWIQRSCLVILICKTERDCVKCNSTVDWFVLHANTCLYLMPIMRHLCWRPKLYARFMHFI